MYTLIDQIKFHEWPNYLSTRLLQLSIILALSFLSRDNSSIHLIWAKFYYNIISYDPVLKLICKKQVSNIAPPFRIWANEIPKSLKVNILITILTSLLLDQLAQFIFYFVGFRNSVSIRNSWKEGLLHALFYA